MNSKRVSFTNHQNDDIKIYLDEQTSTTNNEFSHPQSKVVNSKYINEVVEELTDADNSKIKSKQVSPNHSPSATEMKGEISHSKISIGS
jgi:Pyruvate/2-oxoacid:ferredoxin oxidoreductase gamma subunit|tara:strand:- start:575 stop:841 length:267 start_codon:yes stop_codon:yes gene_type:complete